MYAGIIFMILVADVGNIADSQPDWCQQDTHAEYIPFQSGFCQVACCLIQFGKWVITYFLRIAYQLKYGYYQ
jgi:hypothetical protein